MHTLARRHSPYLPLAAAALLCAGLASAFWPLYSACAVGMALLAFLVFSVQRRPATWQLLAAFCLAGYIILNYGFTNLGLPVGLPLPVGHLLAFAALGLAAAARPREAREFLASPVGVLWLLLLFATLLHLSFDFPQYGIFALRDTTFIVEGAFLLLGFLWARSARGSAMLLRVLGLIFVANFLYALTFPMRESLIALSPKSGIFLRVPLFGFYSQTALFLIVGALFCFTVARHITRLPPATLWFLAMLQASWSLVFQARYAYVALVLGIIVMFFLLGARRALPLAVGLLAAAGLFLLVLALAGVQAAGRVGPVQPEFYIEHLQSLLLRPGAPAVGTITWRIEIMRHLIARWLEHPVAVLVGMGFGMPLTGWRLAGGVITRQPHNTHLSVLARLGIVGFAFWALLHWHIVRMFLSELRRARRLPMHRDVYAWLFSFYVLGLFLTSVQPWLEFSHGAIPFYLLLGFAFGLRRRLLALRATSAARAAPPSRPGARARRYWAALGARQAKTS